MLRYHVVNTTMNTTFTIVDDPTEAETLVQSLNTASQEKLFAVYRDLITPTCASDFPRYHVQKVFWNCPINNQTVRIESF